jgi:hypothetical protein
LTPKFGIESENPPSRGWCSATQSFFNKKTNPLTLYKIIKHQKYLQATKKSKKNLGNIFEETPNFVWKLLKID